MKSIDRLRDYLMWFLARLNAESCDVHKNRMFRLFVQYTAIFNKSVLFLPAFFSLILFHYFQHMGVAFFFSIHFTLNVLIHQAIKSRFALLA